MATDNMEHDSSVTVSLEEFGLSQYEARAYFTLISKGILAARDLAYYSELPRTKVYSIMQKLQKKNLVTISTTKPIMCTATPPAEAFDSALQEQINKINALNSLVSTLKTISEENRRSKGKKERHYHQLSPGNVANELKAMIGGCKKSLRIAVGVAAAGIVSDCRTEILAASNRGADTHILVSADILGTKHGIIPAYPNMRICEHAYSAFIADDANVITLDETGGGDVFSATKTLGLCMSAAFDSQWNKGVAADPLLDMAKTESAEAYSALIRINKIGPAYVLGACLSSIVPDMAQLLEEGGIPIHSKTISELVSIADAALSAACGGAATLDLAGGMITLESAPYHFVWASILDSYLVQRGYRTKIIHNQKGIHIRLEKE